MRAPSARAIYLVGVFLFETEKYIKMQKTGRKIHKKVEKGPKKDISDAKNAVYWSLVACQGA